MAKKIMGFAQNGADVLAKPAKRARSAMGIAVAAAPQAQAKSLAKAAPAKSPTRKFPELTSAQRALHGGITANRDAFSIEAAKARLATAVATKK